MVSNILFNCAENAVKIRRNLIKKHYLETVIVLPPKLFFEVNIDIYVLILRKGREEENVLFINATDLFVKEDANLNKLSKENIKEIVKMYEEFRQGGQITSQRGLIVSPSEIEKDNFFYILLPKRFFRQKNDKLAQVKTSELFEQIRVLFQEVKNLSQELEIIYNNLSEVSKILTCEETERQRDRETERQREFNQ